MSEKQRKDEHREKWGVPFEEVSGRTSGHLLDPPDFGAVERLANIKRGTEVVLAGVASQNDAYDVILTEREAQDRIIALEKTVVKDYATAMGNGGSDQDKEEWTLWKERTMEDLHSQFKKTKVRFAKGLTSSLIWHVLNETPAVDGKRAEQMVDVNKAQVLQDRNNLSLLFPEKKKRSLRHPMGE